MKKLLLSFLICSSLLSFAQDWNPFPLGQKSYFEQYGYYYGVQQDTSTHIYFVDSVNNQGSYQTYLFNYNSDSSFSECYESVIQQINTLGWKAYPNNEKPDSIIVTNDSLFFIYTNSDSVLILPQILVGNSWFSDINNGNTAYNRLKFNCDSAYTDTIIGNILDSVKFISLTTYLDTTPVISSLTNKQFILSKNYGFKQLLSLRNNIGDTFILKGIQSSFNNIGSVMPNFLDYFHLQVGDNIIWKYYEDNPIMTPDTTYYYKDSIIAVNSNADSVIYSIVRTYSNGQSQNTSHNYYKNKLRGLFTSTSSYITGNNLYSNNLSDFYNDMILETSPILQIDGNMTRYFSFDGSNIDTSNCSYNQWFDIGIGIGYDTKYGIRERNNFVFESDYYWTIAGSIINGIQEGVLWSTLVTGINSFENNPNIKIYPNPSQSGNFVLECEQVKSVELVSIDGKTVFSQTINQPKTELKTGLPKGLYFVKLTFENKKQLTQKLIVTE